MNFCDFHVGLDRPFFLIAGPCMIESDQLQMDVAGQLREMTKALGIPFNCDVKAALEHQRDDVALQAMA